jgi:hypothetical protein
MFCNWHLLLAERMTGCTPGSAQPTLSANGGQCLAALMWGSWQTEPGCPALSTLSTEVISGIDTIVDTTVDHSTAISVLPTRVF